jgi:hypothetical protein
MAALPYWNIVRVEDLRPSSQWRETIRGSAGEEVVVTGRDSFHRIELEAIVEALNALPAYR